MKVDPVTGKAYCHDWERDLNRLWKAGYSYGYISWLNPQTDEEIIQVDAVKEEEFRAIGRGKDMTEAVKKLFDELKEHGQMPTNNTQEK